MSFNFTAKEFVPSWLPKEELPPTIVTASTTSPETIQKSPPKSPQKEKRKTEEIQEMMKNTKITENYHIEEIPNSTFENTKEHLNIVFIGHVDAGKSTMGGHILFLTGMVEKPEKLPEFV